MQTAKLSDSCAEDHADHAQREVPDYLREKREASAYDIPIRATLEGKHQQSETSHRS